MDASKEKELQAFAVRMATLETIHSRGTGHIGGARSMVEPFGLTADHIVSQGDAVLARKG